MNRATKRVVMQSLTFATTQENDQLNVGLVRRVDSPFDIFLNFEQLIDYAKRYVYFFVQSTGKRKVIMWGVFDKQANEFIVENGCRYKPIQLQHITRKWREHGYKHASAIVSDKFTERILDYLDIETWSYDDYVVYKRLLAYLDGQIDEDVMEEEYGPNFLYGFLPPEVDPTDPNEIDNYTERLRREIVRYEAGINFTEIDGELAKAIGRPVYALVERITAIFDRQIQEKNYSEESYEQLLGYCPEISTCSVGSGSELCSVYTYGQDGDLYGDDLDMFL